MTLGRDDWLDVARKVDWDWRVFGDIDRHSLVVRGLLKHTVTALQFSAPVSIVG